MAVAMTREGSPASLSDEIRQDVEDALFRLKPWKHETESSVVFGGWARMALPITTFSIVEVSWPRMIQYHKAVYDLFYRSLSRRLVSDHQLLSGQT